MQKKTVLTLTLTLLTGGSTMTSGPPDLEELLPDSVEGWQPASKDMIHTRQNLYEYIDGGAELFLSYGFNRVISRTYSREGQPEITVDLFDMESSANAFGVFSMGREVVDTTFGQGSQYSTGLLLFWRASYYVSILASPETEESKEAVFEAARYIDRSIGRDGPLPGILELLPEDGLVEESVRYFHHHIWLNSHCFISHENILRIDEDVEAVLARYERAGKQCYLLLARYPDSGEARVELESFVEHYLPEEQKLKSPAVRLEDGSWTSCARYDRLVTVVLNAESEEAARELMGRVRKRS